MGLIERAHAQLRRSRHVWTWGLRYWWLDTEAGRRVQIATFCLSTMVALSAGIRLAVAALTALAHAFAPGNAR